MFSKKNSELESNIRKYYFYTFFTNFNLVLPIFTLFYLENGLSLTQVMVLFSITSIVGIFTEVPAGVFADLKGRKTSLLVGVTFLGIGYLLRSLSYDYFMFIVSVCLLAIGISFISGADKALLYDTLYNLKKEKEYKKFAGNAFSIKLTSQAIASMVAGLLSIFGLRFVHLVMVIPIFFAIISCFSLKEPKIHNKVVNHNYFSHLKDSLIFAITHKRIRSLILFASFMTAIMLVSHTLFQPYMKDVGVNVSEFGMFYAFFLLIAALASKLAYSVEKDIGEKASMILIPLLLVIQFFLMGNTKVYVGVFIIFIGEIVWGFTDPIISHYINVHVPSEKRATVLSLNAWGYKWFWAVLSPLFGWIADIYSLYTAFLIMSGFVLVALIIIFFFWIEEKNF